MSPVSACASLTLICVVESFLLNLQFVIFLVVFLVTLTAVVAPVLAAAFRRKVTLPMHQAASMTPAARVPAALRNRYWS